MLATVNLHTDGNRPFDITEEVAGAVAGSGVREGIAVVALPHTTAGVGIISFPDPLGLVDLMDEINRLVPTRIDFKHQFDTPQDAAGHVKSVLIGIVLTLIISESKLLLGHSQGIFFNEFDGPRQREFFVKCSHG